MNKLTKGYAIYSDSVAAKDKYRVTSLPNMQFSTRKKAERHVKECGLSGVKILVVYGLPARMK